MVSALKCAAEDVHGLLFNYSTVLWLRRVKWIEDCWIFISWSVNSCMTLCLYLHVHCANWWKRVATPILYSRLIELTRKCHLISNAANCAEMTTSQLTNNIVNNKARLQRRVSNHVHVLITQSIKTQAAILCCIPGYVELERKVNWNEHTHLYLLAEERWTCLTASLPSTNTAHCIY